MNVYHYHPQTGEFKGIGLADPNPLMPDHWLIPAFSTTDPTPPFPSGYSCQRVGDSWILVEDHRDEVWFSADGERVQIEALGPVPEGAVTQTPRPSFEHRWENGAWTIPPIDVAAIRVKPWPLRMALNQLGLRQQVEDAVAASTDQETKDAWEWASEFARSHPLVVGFGPLLNKSPAEVDQVFLLAHEIGRNMP